MSNADGTCLYIPLSTKTRSAETRSAETPIKRCHRLFRGVATPIKRCHRILQRTIRGYYIRSGVYIRRGILNPLLTRYYAPFVYKPPFHFARIRCEGIFISNLSPPRPRKNSATPTNERKVRTHRTTLYRVQLTTGQRYTDQAIGYATTRS